MMKRVFRTIWMTALAICWSAASTFSAEPVFMDFTNSVPAVAEPLPGSPREAFNLAARKLRDAKFDESERLLQKALESQDERLQAPALYNLGHARFSQGVVQLEKALAAGPATSRGRATGAQADRAAAFAR